MSRTDAHVPLHVRVYRGDIGREEVHDPTDGVCDFAVNAAAPGYVRYPGHCHWAWRWDGHAACSCWMCHGGGDLRRERRRERQRARRELRVVRDRWNW